MSRFGKVDAWVNNAGRGITKSVLQLTDEDLDDMMLVRRPSFAPAQTGTGDTCIKLAGRDKPQLICRASVCLWLCR